MHPGRFLAFESDISHVCERLAVRADVFMPGCGVVVDRLHTGGDRMLESLRADVKAARLSI